jgi:hypothetical protein
MVSLVLLLSLCPMRAGLGRELGSLPAGAHDGGAPQGGKGNTGQTSQAQTSDKKPMTNADVINMVKAGLTENTIVLDIQLSPTAFDTSPQALITLKSQGVPQGILDVMLTSGGGKPSPPAAPPAPTPAPAAGGGANGKLSASPVPSGPAKSSEIKSPPPDLHKIRKVHLMIEEWAEDDNARARATRAIQKYTCLQVVDTPEAADALLSWETQGLMGAALDLYTKDGQDLWNKRGLTAPVKALSQAVGCP